MRLKFTFLLLALTLSMGFVSAQLFSTDGVYSIQNAQRGTFADPNQGAPVKLTAGTGSDFKWIIKENVDNPGKYNIMTLDQTQLLRSAGTRAGLGDNTEANRNTESYGALVSLITRNSGNTRIESNGGDKAWNGGPTTEIGMGTSTTLAHYEWILTRLDDLPTADLTPPILTVTSDLIIDIGSDITYTTDENAKVYLVPDGTDNSDLATIIAASVSSVETFAMSGTLSTAGLAYGDYVIYSVDNSDNFGVAIDVISIVDLSVPQVVAWTFDTDGDTEGWSPANTASGDVANGALTWTWGANNAPKWIKSGLRVSPEDYTKVLVRLKNPNSVEVSTSTNSARIVAVTNGASGSKFQPFSHTNNDTEFHTYIIDIGNLNLSGTLTSVEIQGMRNQDHPEGASLSLSEIRLIRAENTWTGTVSTDWRVAGNWSNNVVPSGEEVVIPMVSNQPAISSGTAEVATLDLADGVVVSVSGEATLRVLSDLTVTGTGHVEVASGSSLVTYGSVAGTNHVINRSTTFDSNTGKYSAVGSPVSGASTSVLGNSWVYSYDETVAYGSDGSARFKEVTTPETMAGGNAYFSAFTGEVTFTGTPHTGDVSVPLAYDANDGENAGFNLVSNPYPAAINYLELIKETNNPNISGTVYLWDDGGSDVGQRSNSDYITVNLVGEVGSATNGSGRSGDWNGHIGSAQGFFVKVTKTDANLNFNNTMKVTGNNASANYFRTEGDATPEIQSVKISLSNADGAMNESLVGFVADATEGYDRLYDADKIGALNGLKLYTLMGQSRLAIQGLPIADESIIPLGVSVDVAGEYTVKIEDIANISDGKSIYLEDTQLGKITKLEKGDEYTFTSGAGVDESRFNLIVSNSVSVLSLDDLDKQGLNVLYTQRGLTISNSDAKVSQAQVSILDISGAMLFNRSIENLKDKEVIGYEFSSNKVYILRVTTESNSFVTKFAFD